MPRRTRLTARVQPRPSGREEAIDAAYAALRRTMGAMHTMHRQAAEGEVTKAQAIMLRIIGFGGPVTPKDLAQRFGLTAGTITSAVDKLEGQGLVARTRSAEDRRVVHVALTAKGQATLTRIEHDTRDQVAELFEGWVVQDIRALQGLLDRLADRAREC